MSKKFSIVKTIDFDNLDNEIDRYMAMTGETNLYLFMNKDTVDAITSAYKVRHIGSYESIPKTRYDDCKGYYCGLKVFVDNDLKFGEVEVR